MAKNLIIVFNQICQIVGAQEREMKMKKKFIFIDTNVQNNDGSYFVSDYDIKSKQLEVGDAVTVYQETDMWNGEIVLSEGGHGVVLKSEAVEINPERYEGHKEEFAEGESVKKAGTIKILEVLNANADLIEEVKKHFGL